MKTVGFIGTGGMGSGMAANLIKAGYRLVVNDLRREQAKGLEGQGAQFKDSPKAVAESVRTRAFDAAEQRCGQGRRPRQGWARRGDHRREGVDRFQQHRQRDHRRRQR